MREVINERNHILIKVCWICLLIAGAVSLPNAPAEVYFKQLATVLGIGMIFFGVLTYFIIHNRFIILSMYGIILCGAFICFYLTYTNPINMNYIMFFSLIGVALYYQEFKILILSFLILMAATNYFFLMEGSVIFVVLPPYNKVNSLIAYNMVIVILFVIFSGQMHVTRKMHREITITNEGLRRVEKELSMDALTGVFNYKYFQYITNVKLEQREPFSFIMIDLDKFKEINDHYGHVAGNKVLQDVTKYLQHQIGSEDMIFRFGGDEFCIIIKNIEDAEKIAEIIYKEKNMCYSEYEGKKIEVCFSAGVYKYFGKEELSFQDLVKKTDKAMYRAKKSGGKKIFHYEYNS